MPRCKGVCIDCGKETSSSKSKRCSACRHNGNKKWKEKGEAQRNHHLRRKYGITLEQFEEDWYLSLGRCHICRCIMKLPTKTRGQALDTVTVDHCHNTGKYRGLLCSRCNKGLGFFLDDISILTRAIGYLKE